MAQLRIEFPRARRTDPISSHAAADSLERSGAIGRQAREALDLVREHPGRTTKQLAGAVYPTGSGPYEKLYRRLGRRLSELSSLGYVEREDPEGAELRWWPDSKED